MKRDLIEIIKEKYDSLSKGQRAIASFLIDHYDKAAFMTAADIGEEVGVSESTVVRFANTIGYSGYKELRSELHELVKTKLTTVQRLSMTDQYSNKENALKRVMEKDIENIQKTISEIDYGEFEKAIELILGARNVYILGMRSSSFLAGYIGFYLKFLVENSKVIVAGPNDVFEQLLKVDSSDVLLGISYPRYSRRTLEAIDFSKEKGCKIISITDSMDSPAAQEADITLIASNDMLSFVDSLVAPMSLINALMVTIGMAKSGDVKANFEDLEKIWNKYDVYDSYIKNKNK